MTFVSAEADVGLQVAYQLRGEFERQAGLLVSGHLAEAYPSVYHQMVDGTPNDVQIVTLVEDQDQHGVIDAGLGGCRRPRECVSLVEVPHSSKWVRDFAPMVLMADGPAAPLLLDAHYLEGREHLPGNRLLARRMGLSLAHQPINFEGGNLLTNGEGLGVTSTALFTANPTLSQTQVLDRLSKTYGLHQIVVLERLDGETTGHVDMFATFTASNTVVVGSYERAARSKKRRDPRP